MTEAPLHGIRTVIEILRSKPYAAWSQRSLQARQERRLPLACDLDLVATEYVACSLAKASLSKGVRTHSKSRPAHLMAWCSKIFLHLPSTATGAPESCGSTLAAPELEKAGQVPSVQS